MTKKAKKAKKPKVKTRKNNGRGSNTETNTDPITGGAVNTQEATGDSRPINENGNALRFKSDFVYEGTVEVSRISNYAVLWGADPKIEIEYDDKYFVVTQARDNQVSRRVYIGSFDIANDGIIKRATVNEERTVHAESGSPLWPPELASKLINIFPHSPYTLENVDGLVRFWAASVTARRATGEYTIPATPDDPINQRFFPNGWWNDPFAPNLI